MKAKRSVTLLILLQTLQVLSHNRLLPGNCDYDYKFRM
jgi:hypothetical protein